VSIWLYNSRSQLRSSWWWVIELWGDMTCVNLTLRSRSTVPSAPGLHFVRLLLEKWAFLDGLRWQRGRIGIPRLGGMGR